MTLKRPSLLVAASAAIMALSGCATGFKADVARFQQLPPPSQGQTFTVQAGDPREAGGLEFAHYAKLVGDRLVAHGYQQASDPASAQLVVRLDYGVDAGRERIRSSGFNDPFMWGPAWGGMGWGRGWGGGGWGRGWGGRYMYGFYDPFMWGGGGFNDVSSYTVYGSQLRLRIDKAGSGGSVFEGTARAQSMSNKLTYLVPNLIDAMFTGFPGNNGEEVRVTVAPEPRKK